MGNREDLLAGALHCLLEVGYARASSREIAEAAGVSMGAISYHFESRETLLVEALVGANQEWGAQVEAELARSANAGSPAQRFQRTWTAVIESMTKNHRLWAVTMEAVMQTNQPPATRKKLLDALEQARAGLARLLAPDTGQANEGVSSLGSFYQALLTGVAVQFLIDGRKPLDGTELTATMQAALAHLRLKPSGP